MTQKLDSWPEPFITTDGLRRLMQIENRRTFENAVKRLVKNGGIIFLEKGKFQLLRRDTNDFATAQFLYSPSYVSFETALNYHGVLLQFPYEITSATTKKRTNKEINGKVFGYYHLNKAFFTGYEKIDGSLMALPEKALFDQLYLGTKGLKSLNNLDEMDWTLISKTRLLGYFKLISKKQQQLLLTAVKPYI